MRPSAVLSTLDVYVLRQMVGTLVSVFALVLSLMLVEHFPHLLDMVSHSGRRGFVVIRSILALLPEYAGIGLLFGLYLSIALTVRRFSLRGELDAINGIGISTLHWMRVPALLAVTLAGLTLWTQGWLVPAGEVRLRELGRQMLDGRFGFNLEAGTFNDLGRGVTLRFADVDPTSHDLRRVFIRMGDRTFTASSGRLGFDFAGKVLVDLKDGRVLDSRTGQSLAFSAFRFESRKAGANGVTDDGEADLRKRMRLPELLASRDDADNAAGWARLLWPVFALMIPWLAVVLGKPQRRRNGALGLMLGLVLVVVFIRGAGAVTTAGSSHPALLALGMCAGWMAVVVGLLWGERRWGAGYVDRALLKAIGFLQPRGWRRASASRKDAEDGRGEDPRSAQNAARLWPAM